ncbi:phosphoinositide phosphatase SAC6 isoform X1 [Cinnamomum micranthum f. kanehirae]|uniref:Phosphoinositide phosphatase SAC6 isoform X1 n=1 Tax=Cinnamomum micranthum f. kanehirae TaxID=337451 RepID=A0A3S3MZF8_9MAGN|nr:phosphoinositide phosphatase SAC6 isoform X1 [Cinnamomum micranthum f. kanehirae]
MLSLGLSCALHLLRPNRSFRSPFLVPPPSPSPLPLRNFLLPSKSNLQNNLSITSPSPLPLPLSNSDKIRFKMDKVVDNDAKTKLYTNMRLWELPDQYIVEPTDGGTTDSYLAISRMDGSLNLIGELPQMKAPKIRNVYGVVGMLKLIAGKLSLCRAYVVVITERECVGSYLGHPIFRVSSLKILPCNLSLKTSSPEQKKMETEFSVLLNAAERTSGLYFSYDVNLTLSAQKLHELGDESKLLPLWRQADPRFLWNNYMLEVLIDNKLEPYLLPVIQGSILNLVYIGCDVKQSLKNLPAGYFSSSFQSIQSAVGKNNVDVTLIARRCTRRTGTRMWRRGADLDGYVANFVESEQIMQSNGNTTSFVQVRGSIPILWEQIVDLTYKPKFEVVRPEEAPRVAERHFLDLRKRYGSVLAVDLVKKHGSEGRLSEKYASAMQNILSDDIKYVHFDFHQICGHIQFDRLSILYDQIADYLKKQGYFWLNTNGEKVKEQHGVVRNNCIDCLDRTNATQSMIGRKMLENQLQEIGIFGANETISAHPNFDERFKILWANHGDEISFQYSGTPALKRDLVRYGKQTVPGILGDGWNALSRYYLNNFCDGTKQDAMDLLHGHYIVSVNRDMASTSQIGSSSFLTSLPLASALVLAGVVFAAMSLKQAQNDSRHLFLSVFFAGVSLSIAAFVRANGRKFCNRPRLHKPRG